MGPDIRRQLDGRDFDALASSIHALEDVGEVADALATVPGHLEYLAVDLSLVRLLEDVLERLPPDDLSRLARVRARLALELRGDPTTVERRTDLLAAAVDAAESVGDPRAVAEAYLALVHAIWEPGSAAERLQAAERAIEASRRGSHRQTELDARMTRVDVLLGLGRITDAEVELRTFSALLDESDHARRAFAASRRCAIAVVQGRLEEAERELDELDREAEAADLPDRQQVRTVFRAALARERGDPRAMADVVALLQANIRRFPGHHYEAVLARGLHDLGRDDEAKLELYSAMSSLRTRRGPQWLPALYDAAITAVAVGEDDDRAWLLDRLSSIGSPVASLTTWLAGPTRTAAGLLASSLGRHEEARVHLDRAVLELKGMSALPWLARSLRARATVLREAGETDLADADDAEADRLYRTLGLADLPMAPLPARKVWELRPEVTGWRLVTDDGEVHLPAGRGLAHLHVLLRSPGVEIPAVVLESGGAVLTGDRGVEVLDERAKHAYRDRLATIDAQLASADGRGDPDLAEALEAERSAVVSELKAAVGLGGRGRRTSDTVERSRVNVTRNLRRALERIIQVAPVAGLHLSSSVRTGTTCCYEPREGGPDSWRTA